MAAASPPVAIEVWPEHHAVWDVWIGLQSTWSVVGGMFGPTGYQGFARPAAESVMRMRRVKHRDQAAMLDDLEVMERAALPVLNAR